MLLKLKQLVICQLKELGNLWLGGNLVVGLEEILPGMCRGLRTNSVVR